MFLKQGITSCLIFLSFCNWFIYVFSALHKFEFLAMPLPNPIMRPCVLFDFVPNEKRMQLRNSIRVE